MPRLIVQVGMAAAAAAGRALATQLFEISPLDPVTFVLVPVALLAAAAAACFVPALRAARLDPLTAIRRDL